MNRARLVGARRRRLNAKRQYEAAHELALNDALEAIAGGADVAEVARLVGVARGTIYNELARRQERRDELSSNGPPPPAPADTDR